MTGWLVPVLQNLNMGGGAVIPTIAIPTPAAWLALVEGNLRQSPGQGRKTAGDTRRFAMDFGDVPELINGYSILSYTVTCAGLSAILPRLDYPYQLSASFSGGSPGMTYTAVFTIVLDDPDNTTYVRNGLIRIR